MFLTRQQLSSLLGKDSSEWYDILHSTLLKYEINTTSRLAGFLSQTVHESMKFTALEENFNYSANRLNVVFPKYFKRAGRDASRYHRQPQKIANVVYANRMGNGDENSNDGWVFRGGGLLQLTGRDNYTAFGLSIGKTPEQAAEYTRTKKGAIESACWFWASNNLNKYCDANDIEGLSKRINGGTNGLADRKHLWFTIISMLNSDGPTLLKIGSKGIQVIKVQKKLYLKPDGLFGIETHKAVVKFQLEHNLKPDGIVGPSTYKAMSIR